MDLRTHPFGLILERNRTLRITDAAGASIAVHDGTVWVTQEGDPTDRVLGAGERFVADRGGVAVLQALDDARVTVSAPATGRGVPAGTDPTPGSASASRPAIRMPRRWYVGASNAA